ncbi:insulinase family protein [Halomonas sp. Bachu 37]|uniref:insulinase family protein n=1 Tax=Halomonas kashgarensis TaxID=3084920 RepID=UPI003216A483
MPYPPRPLGRPHRLIPMLSVILLVSASWPGIALAEKGLADVTTPVVSPYDSREYRILELENGLTALLISDPEADKAAASMNIDVGSAQDPDDLQGLAHFLEHMLFLGTESYPESDAYQSYITRHAGSHNAFTAQQDTNYFFDIEPSALPGALDRFSEFFISPLFNADQLESERNIVHSEYMARIRDEGRRENDVLNQLLNPENPTTGFAVGSRETLASPPAGEPSLRERVMDFYHAYYDANVMHLAVVAPQPLDELETLILDRFTGIADRDLERPVVEAPLAKTDTLPRYAEVQSIRDSRQLRFFFPVPDPTSDYRHKPSSLIAHLLGHEGEGSLLAVLRQAGLADALSTGVGRADGQDALFTVTISLTPEGAERIEDIEATLFAAIEQIRESGLEQWRYQEQAKLAEQSFRFQQHGAPQQEATRLAMSLSRYPVEDVQYAPYRMEGFDRERVSPYLDALRPDNLIRLYIGPEVAGDTPSPWFNAPWNELETPTPGTALGGLALPEPNPYIAEDLTLLNGYNALPRVLIDEPALTLWHKQDDTFDTPKVEWRFSLQNPTANYSAEEAVLARLLAGWLNDSLNQTLYPAWLAGQAANAYAHSRGITLAFSGWRDGQAPLVEEVLEQLESGRIDPASFERVRYQLQREWRNAPQASLYSQASRTLGEALLTPQWSFADMLEASERLTLFNLRDFRQRFMDDLHVDAMAVGNLGSGHAIELTRRVEELLTPRLSREEVGSLTPLAVGEEPPILHPHSEREESLVLHYLQGSQRTLEEQAEMSVLAQWLQSPFYQRLRTEEQLGYVVNAAYSPLLDAPGIALVVQSSDADSDTIAERIEAFLAQTGMRLEALDDEALAPYRQAVHDCLTQRDTSLAGMANRFWQATVMEDVAFDHQQRRANLALEVSVEALRDQWETWRSQALEIRFDPDDAPSDIQPFRDSREPLPEGS